MNRASPLITVSISGVKNCLVDIPSRTFNRQSALGETFCVSDEEFLTSFNSQFPLPQGNLWQCFCLSNKLASLVFAKILGQTLTLGSWLCLTEKGRKRCWQFWCACIEPFHHMDPVPLVSEMTRDKPSFVGSLNRSSRVLTMQETTTSLSGMQPYKSHYMPLGQRCKLDTKPNPLYHSEGKYWKVHPNEVKHDTIHKMGRWSSDTFLMYIHEQISSSHGLSKKMQTEIGWHNIEGPRLDSCSHSSLN